MRFFRRKVKVTPYELGKVLSRFTWSYSDISRHRGILREVGGFVSLKERYLENAHKEWFIMNMFGIVCACQQAIPRDKCDAVLDAYHHHICNHLSYIGWTYPQINEFELLVKRRYKDYQKTLRVKNPRAPLHYLGKYAARYMFGERYSHNSSAITINSATIADTIKATTKMIQKGYELI